MAQLVSMPYLYSINHHNEHGYDPIELNSQKQVVGWIWSVGHGLLTSCIEKQCLLIFFSSSLSGILLLHLNFIFTLLKVCNLDWCFQHLFLFYCVLTFCHILMSTFRTLSILNIFICI